MDMMTYDGKVDVFNFVLGMRKQRNFMVQTEVWLLLHLVVTLSMSPLSLSLSLSSLQQQYIFIHDALVETIKVSQTEISVTNFRKELLY